MTLRIYNSTYILNEYEKHISDSYPRVTDVPYEELVEILKNEYIGKLDYEEFIDNTGKMGYKLTNDVWEIELTNAQFETALMFRRGVAAAVSCKKGDDVNDILLMNILVEKITDKYASIYMEMDKANYL